MKTEEVVSSLLGEIENSSKPESNYSEHGVLVFIVFTVVNLNLKKCLEKLRLGR